MSSVQRYLKKALGQVKEHTGAGCRGGKSGGGTGRATTGTERLPRELAYSRAIIFRSSLLFLLSAVRRPPSLPVRKNRRRSKWR
jgi:hypothetical protein